MRNTSPVGGITGGPDPEVDLAFLGPLRLQQDSRLFITQRTGLALSSDNKEKVRSNTKKLLFLSKLLNPQIRNQNARFPSYLASDSFPSSSRKDLGPHIHCAALFPAVCSVRLSEPPFPQMPTPPVKSNCLSLGLTYLLCSK